MSETKVTKIGSFECRHEDGSKRIVDKLHPVIFPNERTPDAYELRDRETGFNVERLEKGRYRLHDRKTDPILISDDPEAP